MRRRTLLRGTAMAACALTVVRCASVTAVPVSAVADDINLVARGLAVFAAVPPLAADAAVQGAVAEAASIAAAVASAAPQLVLPTAQTWVTALVHDAAVILPAVAAVPGLPPRIATALSAVPVLLAGLQAVVALTPAGVARAAAMTPDQARAALAAL